VNSLRISFFTRKDADSDSPNATIVKPDHQSGIRHQSGYACDEKPDMRLATTSKGNAISIASDCRKASVSDGTRLLPIIQKPSRPMPRSASTACKVIRKTLTLLQFYMAHTTLTSLNNRLYLVLFPHGVLGQKLATLPQTLTESSSNRAICLTLQSSLKPPSNDGAQVLAPHPTSGPPCRQSCRRFADTFPRLCPPDVEHNYATGTVEACMVDFVREKEKNDKGYRRL
jgi:hypothetical protein